MQSKSTFHVFVPNLFQTLQYCLDDLSLEIEAPQFSKLCQNFEKQYCKNSFGLENTYFKLLDPSMAELPSAYYRNQIHNKTIKERLICADPIHLQVGMNDVTLKKKVVDLADSEALELIEVLNQHFNEEGLEFIFGSNKSWYIANDKDEDIQSYDLESMMLKNVVDKQLKSSQRNWQRIQNEIQMLLHNAEINRHRELADLDVVNSLWLWGAGKPIKPKTMINAVYSFKDSKQKDTYEYLAKAADCKLQVLPNKLEEILEVKTQNQLSNIILLDPLIAPSSSDQIDTFQDIIKMLDEQIFDPLFSAWKNNKILIELHTCEEKVIKPIQPSFLKSLFKSKTLRETVNEVSS